LFQVVDNRLDVVTIEHCADGQVAEAQITASNVALAFAMACPELPAIIPDAWPVHVLDFNSLLFSFD
jgi:hypothetical protein